MAQVEVMQMACFYGVGARTMHSDKIWGNCKIDGTVVSFWGRRNGRLSFKTRAGNAGKVAAESKWSEKIGGRRDGGDVYTPVTEERIRTLLCPTLQQDVVSHYYSKMSKGQLNTRG